jgi:choline dehydrogenase-like flavoprotein
LSQPDNFIFAVIQTLIPTATELTKSNFNDSLDKKSAVVQKQFNLFLTIIRKATFIRYWQNFEQLEEPKRVKVLIFFEKSPFSKIRLGFWGLRSMVLLAHYGELAHSEAIGFTGPIKVNLPNYQEDPQDPFSVADDSSIDEIKTKKLKYDIVIIGSGAGGGVVAERLIPLLDMGYSIAVLESGANYRPKSYFNQQEQQMPRLFWEGGGLLNKEGTMTLAAARMVGGSTGVYTGVTFDLPEAIFDSWNMEMKYSDFQERLLKHRQAFNTHKLSKDRINHNNVLFKTGAEGIGVPVKDLDISTKECQGSGFCNLGCVNDAKMSTLNVQLPKAEAAGIELIANCHVETIAEGKIQASIYAAPEGTTVDSHEVGRYEIEAGKIIVAAGCYGTNTLLSRSKLQYCSPNLGRNITMHPVLTVYGRHSSEVEGFKNFPKAYYVDEYSASEGHIIETAFYYPGITAKNLDGWGREHQRRMNSYANTMCAIILAHDKPKFENSIYWDGSRPVIDYTIDDSTLESLRMGQIRAAQIYFAAGCDEVYMPFAKDGIVRRTEAQDLHQLITLDNYLANSTLFASAHPQGGCGMGDEDAVCDNRGRLRGYKNIYVADASLFPTSSHVNPCLTVMALADIVADTILADLAKVN